VSEELNPIDVCVHVKLGELTPYVLLTVTPSPAFATPGRGQEGAVLGGPIVRRVKCCALCFGWIEAVTRFGLPVNR
jgi:hypothetical protein